jgi:hypothetical protein
MNSSFMAPAQQSSSNIWATPSPVASQNNAFPQQAGAFAIAPPTSQSPYSGFGIAPPPVQQQRIGAVSTQTQSTTQNQAQNPRQGIDKYESLL